MNQRTRPRFIRTPPTPQPRRPLLKPWRPLKPEWPTRDDCAICNSRRDALGRLPIGLCGPDCLMARSK